LFGSLFSSGGLGKPNPFGVYPDNTGVGIRWTAGPSILDASTGSFGSNAAFTVPAGSNGILLQMIPGLSSDVNGVDGLPASAVNSDMFNRPYVEAWQVVNGVVQPNVVYHGNTINDVFQAGGFNAPFSGSYSRTGYVQYHPRATMADFPEMKQGAVGAAGGLYATYATPVNWVSTGALLHQVTVTFTSGTPTISSHP
jgi:hypothetical protein